jgi:hypothetical protein
MTFEEILLGKRQTLHEELKSCKQIAESAKLTQSWSVVQSCNETIKFNKRMIALIEKSFKEAGYTIEPLI